MATDEKARSGNGLGEGGSITDRGEGGRNGREPVLPEDANLSLPTGVCATAAAPTETTKEEGMVRYGTRADLDRIEALTPEHFAVDFSNAPFPHDEGPLTDEELDALVEQFLETLKEPPEVRDGH
jgi:hypothetical protein